MYLESWLQVTEVRFKVTEEKKNKSDSDNYASGWPDSGWVWLK